jgi:15-cis-phytoene desaturase
MLPAGDIYISDNDRIGRWPLFGKDDIEDAAGRVVRLIQESPTGFEEVWVLGAIEQKPILCDLIVDLMDRLPGDKGSWEKVPTPSPPEIYVLHNKDAKKTLRFGFADYQVDDPLADEEDEARCLLVVREQLTSGEHGYRFFPSFYRNLFDTMKRIPVLQDTVADPAAVRIMREYSRTSDETVELNAPTHETVYSHIVSIPRHAIATFDGRAPLELERIDEGSLFGGQAMLRGIIDRLGFAHRDLIHSQLRMLRYATSCRARRGEYEHMTWEEFLEADVCSEPFKNTIRHWAQALVGLVSNRADARSFGSVQLQLLLDQLKREGLRDGSLDAPTSEAWFDHWRDHLETNLGVKFQRGTLERLVADPAGGLLAQWRKKNGTQRETFSDQYVVVALDINAAIGIAEESQRVRPRASGNPAHTTKEDPVGSLLALNARFPAMRESKVQLPTKDAPKRPSSDSELPVADYAGIQFFLEEEHFVLRGHIYYPQSPWRLTSVAPTIYRRKRPSARERAAGLVSVIIGDWTTPWTDEAGAQIAPAAERCSADELAKYTWAQIRHALKGTDTPPPEMPLAYHLDESIQFDASGRVARHKTRFLLNDVRLADWWPEEPGNYRVHDRRVVFAGNWLKTCTRLVTMESACESGRHAANAILEDYAAQNRNAGFTGVPIFDPEENEPPDLDWLRRLDAELFERGLPHLLDILGVDEAVRKVAGEAEMVELAELLKTQMRGALESREAFGPHLAGLITRAAALFRRTPEETT